MQSFFLEKKKKKKTLPTSSFSHHPLILLHTCKSDIICVTNLRDTLKRLRERHIIRTILIGAVWLKKRAEQSARAWCLDSGAKLCQKHEGSVFDSKPFGSGASQSLSLKIELKMCFIYLWKKKKIANVNVLMMCISMWRICIFSGFPSAYEVTAAIRGY